MLQQINQAWEQAKEQLETLRAEVTRTAEMAQASLKSKFANRERDAALRDFGEAVWNHMKAGKLQLPPALTSAVKAMLAIEKKAALQASEILDILQEGAEAAAKKTLVASKGKKR